MASRTIVQLIDDLDGKEDRSVQPNIPFSFDGIDYLIDLSDKNRAKLEDALAPFIVAARVVNPRSARARQIASARQRTTTSSGNGNGKTKVDPTQNKAIREWARKSGYQVSNSGRIPEEITDAYQRADGKPSAPPPPIPDSTEVKSAVGKAVAKAVATKVARSAKVEFKPPAKPAKAKAAK